MAATWLSHFVVFEKYRFPKPVFSLLLLYSAKGIGCFRDTGRRAISTLEGRSRLLKGNYQRRLYAFQKCASAALRRGWRMFALQNGGWCASSRRAHLTFARYGRSNKCRRGKGGPWANNVYVLRGMDIMRMMYFFQSMTKRKSEYSHQESNLRPSDFQHFLR